MADTAEQWTGTGFESFRKVRREKLAELQANGKDPLRSQNMM